MDATDLDTIWAAPYTTAGKTKPVTFWLEAWVPVQDVEVPQYLC